MESSIADQGDLDNSNREAEHPEAAVLEALPEPPALVVVVAAAVAVVNVAG